jgi:hypothetical protein
MTSTLTWPKRTLFLHHFSGSTIACSTCDVILEEKFINLFYICETKQFFLEKYYTQVIGLLLKLGFLISWKKSELVPSQDVIFLGEHYRTDLGLVFSPEEKIVTLQFLVNKFFRYLNQIRLTNKTQ